MTTLQNESIIKVGDGRGFIVEDDRDKMIITAAHCLPHLPPAALVTYLEEKTYEKLIGVLGGPLEIWAECIFADPISDIAILKAPDDQELFEQYDAYSEFTEKLKPIAIREAKEHETVWMVCLDGKFRSAVVNGVNKQMIQIKADAGVIEPGMSGSPIIGDDGLAVSVVALVGNHPEWLMEANLLRCLPGWFFYSEKKTKRRKV